MARSILSSAPLCAPSCSLRPLEGRQSRPLSAPSARHGSRLIVRAEDRDPSDPLSKVAEAAEKAQAAVKDIFTDDNVLEYCSLDEKGRRPLSKKSLGEKEADFLNALASFYYDDKPVMTNEEFDNLKEELIWEGSSVAVLSATEQRFMEVSLAYAAKKPIVTDEEYDQLKTELRDQNSKVTQQGPRCSLRSRAMYSDASVDYLKVTLLNTPAVITTLFALFSVDDITGFKITSLLELPQPWGILVTWGCVLPLVFLIASALTNLVFKDGIILNGTCPNCGKGTQTYFGDIFVVQGPRETATVTCEQCKKKMEFNASKRWVVIKDTTDGPGTKQKPQDKPKEQKKPADQPKSGGQERKQPATA